VPLVALDAVVEIEGSTGRREIAVEALHCLPGETPQREAVLEPGDLIVAVRLPGEARTLAAHARYLKVRERTSYAFAVVSAAACLRIEKGTIEDPRLSLRGVAAKPWRARSAEKILTGCNPGSVAFGQAAKVALADAKPSGDNQFKIELAHHNAMEAHAIVAAWDDDTLSIDMPTQALVMVRARIAEFFDPHSQPFHWRRLCLKGLAGPQILGIMAARLVGRPVKLVLRREHMYGPVGHRAPTRQRIRIGGDSDGRLTAIDHHSQTTSSTFDDFFEPAAHVSHTLYASPASATSHEAVRIDTGTPLFMRAPGENLDQPRWRVRSMRRPGLARRILWLPD
jgi:CO/xanthine dehydrogenase Mo-binding subunit